MKESGELWGVCCDSVVFYWLCLIECFLLQENLTVLQILAKIVHLLYVYIYKMFYYFQLILLPLKILLFTGLGVSWYDDMLICVWVTNGDCLILICEIVNHTLGEDIEWLAKEYVVGWSLYNMCLQIDCDRSNMERYILSKTKGPIDFSIS